MPCWMVWIQFDSSKSFRLLSDWFIRVENEKEKHTDGSSFIELFVALLIVKYSHCDNTNFVFIKPHLIQLIRSKTMKPQGSPDR